jgi:hypothetical protein
VIYNTPLTVIFAVKKYAAALMEVVKEKSVVISCLLNRLFDIVEIFN